MAASAVPHCLQKLASEGFSAPHLAQQYVGQMQMFYGALAWYLNQHPRHAEVLFEQLRRPAATDRPLALPAE